MNEAVKFTNLSRDAMQLSAQIIVDSADLAFLLWPEGQIADVSVGTRTGLATEVTNLKHRDVSELVLPEDAGLLSAMVAQARNGQRPRSVRLRHSALVQAGTMARYTAHLAGDGMNVMLLGSALSAELSLSAQAASAEIARQRRTDPRMTEARYRMLFESSAEGLLIVDQASGLIEQANGNAAAMIGQSAERLSGTPLWLHFADEPGGGPEAIPGRLEMLAQLAVTGNRVKVSVQAVRSLDRTQLIVRLEDAANMDEADDAPAIELLRRTSVPVLLTDHECTICWSNGAFVALAGNTPLIGLPVAEVMGISSHALDVALRQADAHGRTPTSLAALGGQGVMDADAHVTIVAIPGRAAESYGFVVHRIGDQSQDPAEGPDSHALAELVGKAPLKTLVRRSTDVIERNCIEAALRLTGTNRAAAASVLGLSRQSLYLKMRQHGLG